jgi:hypothetical protein
MQSLKKGDSHLQRRFQKLYLPASEQHESWRYGHVLLCKMHNDGNAMWTQTQNSLQWRSSPVGGRQDTPSPGSVQVLVQRKVKCWFPVSLDFSLWGQIPLGDSGFLFLCLTTGVSELEKFVFTGWSPDLHVNGNKPDSERQGWCVFSQKCNIGAKKIVLERKGN